MNTKPQPPNPQPHHLNIHDMDRAMTDNTPSDNVHLRCNEDDCFIEDSELNASDATVMEGTEADTHPPTPSTKAPRS